jgi:hypothetical protein
MPERAPLFSRLSLGHPSTPGLRARRRYHCDRTCATLAVCLVLLGVCACKRTSTNAIASRQTDAGSVSSGGSRSDGPECAVGSLTLERGKAEQLLFEWNSALDSHDVERLRPLYASHVAYYGTQKTSDEALRAKQDALQRAPKFRARVAREYPDVRASGILYGTSPHSVDVRVGYTHPDRFEPRWLVTVERGELKIADMLTTEPLVVPEYHRAKVRRICGTPDSAIASPGAGSAGTPS